MKEIDRIVSKMTFISDVLPVRITICFSTITTVTFTWYRAHAMQKRLLKHTQLVLSAVQGWAWGEGVHFCLHLPGDTEAQ